MPRILALVLLLGVTLPSVSARANAIELFARGAMSKNYLSTDSYIISVSAATGVAFTLIPRVRLEARYTNSSSLQNKLSITLRDSGGNPVDGSLHDILTQTSIYSVGIDIDVLGPRNEFQPFIYVGAGYVHTVRSYYVMDAAATTSVYLKETPETGISGNAGLGFRLRVANALALEAEAFAYATNVTKPNPQINIFGSAGIRIFL